MSDRYFDNPKWWRIRLYGFGLLVIALWVGIAIGIAIGASR